jgi:Icc-related predicted phosphoesterase
MHGHTDDYLISHIKDALAADERVSQLDIDIKVMDDQLVLTGCVSTDDRRRAAAEVAAAIAPGRKVVNELRIVDVSGSTPPSGDASVRVAAVGDIHIGVDSSGHMRSCLERIQDDADLLLLAGDLTRHGDPAEAKVLADDLRHCPVPVVAVLGNHDHQSDRQHDVAGVLTDAGVIVLEGQATTIEVRGTRVGIGGTKGFGGGFVGACGSEFGERIQKDFIAHSRSLAESLASALHTLDADVRIALTHFSPVRDTLRGEPPEIYPWLGSYFLAEAIDNERCDIGFHGHAHAGSEIGTTAGGVPVRNVAQPVIGDAYKVYPVTPVGTGRDQKFAAAV